jgi:hypothetical protein
MNFDRKEDAMSDRQMWKMLHLLYTLKPGIPGLSGSQLKDAGVDCGPDTIDPLLKGKVVVIEDDIYKLTEAGKTVLRTCVVGNRRWPGRDIWVDYPEVFVVMPFNEPWSDEVYNKMIKPAVEGANFRCERGDTPPRVGDLTQTIWNAIVEAGLIVADVSVVNPNVFYEIGLAHALGKDVFILKQREVTVPADFGGSHYYEYELSQLDTGQDMLRDRIKKWGNENKVEGVKAIRDG